MTDSFLESLRSFQSLLIISRYMFFFSYRRVTRMTRIIGVSD